jgi:predicted HicB family RNase H-like nuclease
MSKLKLISLRLPEDLHTQAKMLCVIKKISLQKFVSDLIEKEVFKQGIVVEKIEC